MWFGRARVVEKVKAGPWETFAPNPFASLCRNLKAEGKPLTTNGKKRQRLNTEGTEAIAQRTRRNKKRRLEAGATKQNAPTGVGAHFSTALILPGTYCPCQQKH